MLAIRIENGEAALRQNSAQSISSIYSTIPDQWDALRMIVPGIHDCRGRRQQVLHQVYCHGRLEACRMPTRSLEEECRSQRPSDVYPYSHIGYGKNVQLDGGPPRDM